MCMRVCPFIHTFLKVKLPQKQGGNTLYIRLLTNEAIINQHLFFCFTELKTIIVSFHRLREYNV